MRNPNLKLYHMQGEFQLCSINVAQGISSQEMNAKTCLGWMKAQGPPAKDKQSYSMATFSQPGTHVCCPPGQPSQDPPHASALPLETLLGVQSCRFSLEGTGILGRGWLQSMQPVEDVPGTVSDSWKEILKPWGLCQKEAGAIEETIRATAKTTRQMN
jgi:hypothetical protein